MCNLLVRILAQKGSIYSQKIFFFFRKKQSVRKERQHHMDNLVYSCVTEGHTIPSTPGTAEKLEAKTVIYDNRSPDQPSIPHYEFTAIYDIPTPEGSSGGSPGDSNGNYEPPPNLKVNHEKPTFKSKDVSDDFDIDTTKETDIYQTVRKSNRCPEITENESDIEDTHIVENDIYECQ